VAWSTLKKIRVIHFSKKQKICLIERPALPRQLPDYLLNQTVKKPTMYWRGGKREDNPEGCEVLVVAWMNVVKECRLREKDGRYAMEVIRK
jgi:hypothetical protein